MVVVAGAALALLWSLGRTIDRSLASASDSQLSADLQIARATLDGDVALAAGRASALAQLVPTQEALARGDAAALRAIAAANPGSLLIAAGGARGGALPLLGVRRVAVVVAGGRPIGEVVTEAPLDSGYLDRVQSGLAAGTHDLVVVTVGGRVAAGPLPRGADLAVTAASDVSVGGRSFRAVSTPAEGTSSQIRIVALARRTSDGFSSWRLPLAMLATVAALLLLVSLGPFGSRERTGNRRPQPAPEPSAPPRNQMPGAVALLGETLAATHDTDALLALILDAAIEATGAVGGRVVSAEQLASPLAFLPRNVLTVPLDTNEPGGSSLVLYPPRNGFTPEAEGIARWLGIQAGTAIKNARLHRVIEQHALTDELTGLANRRHFTATLNAELGRAERFDTPLALLLCDLDGLKSVNDRFGHPAGDKVLRAFARALQRSVRRIDLAARIGGDEFAVLLPQTDTEGAAQVAERMRAELRLEQGLPERVTASYGVSHYPQAHSAEELLIAADVCLYQAKEGGRDKVVQRATDPLHDRAG